MLFRLLLYNTEEDDKYLADTEDRYEFLGNLRSIWFLWHTFKVQQKKKHVEVFNLDGVKQQPEKGYAGMAY